MLKTTKVYIDSRYAVYNSGSSIEYQIPGGLELRPATRIWLSEFTCVAAWDTIDNSNNRLYVQEGTATREIYIPNGVYDLESLRIALYNGLNSAGKTESMGTYGVALRAAGSAGGTHRAYEVFCTRGTFGLPREGTSSTNSIASFPTSGVQRSSHVSGSSTCEGYTACTYIVVPSQPTIPWDQETKEAL